jgi:hypothetical protein
MKPLRDLAGLIATASLMGLAACNTKDLVVDPKAEAAAQQAYAQFVTGQDDALLAGMPDDAKTPAAHKMVAALRELVPAGPATAAKLIGWRANSTTSGPNQVIIYRYDYGADHLTIATTLVRANDSAPWRVLGFNVKPSAAEEVQAPSLGPDADIPPVKPAAAKSAA